MHRRQFLETALAGAASAAAPPSPWGSPVLDIHFHFRPGPGANLEHLDGCGVTKAVLLTRTAAEEEAKAAVQRHPGRFVRFSSADITKPEAFAQLKQSAKGGALGFGEMKFHVAVDGPEMRRLYDLAAEMRVPVLIHFQEVPQFAGEGVFNTPFDHLPAMLKAHPKTIFIGHGDAFWSHISADVPADVPYPEGKIKPGGLTDRMLSDFPNLYADLSANSGRNAIGRDPEFYAGFAGRHQDKLMFGSDCSCRDGHGSGQRSQQPLIKGRCVARETLTALKQITSPALFRKITWENGARLLKIPV
ncbi:MAG: amidohydrolase family protein [Bryobacterales bacterium]|nr:amidohydrolase family protein [Bryobacterales bacterium]